MTTNTKDKEKNKVTAEMVSKAVSPKKNVEKKIYVGPNVQQLIKYTVIDGDLPVHISDFIEKCPEAGKLLVPLKDLVAAERSTSKKGTLEHRNYKAVEMFSEKGGGGE